MSELLISLSEKAPWLVWFLLAVGVLFVIWACWHMAWTFVRHCLRCSQSLDKYKGTDSWVLVTGGSDGIGLAICHEMAAKGFNICMVARNPGKMDEKLKEVVAKNTVKTRAIVFDFNEFTTIDKYQELIADKVKDIDVAMVYLNAGFGQPGAFEKLTNGDIQKLVSVNVLQLIYCAKVMTP